MNRITKYQPRRNQYWPEIERFFGDLPPRLFKQGVLLKNNLATFYADTGQFKDILSRDRDYPLLYLHFWLLDDFRVPPTAGRAELEKRLFLAMIYTFAAAYTRESILDEATNFDNSYLFLEHILSQKADFHLAQLYPGQSPFWERYQAFWYEHAEALLSTVDRRPSTVELVSLTPDSGMLAFAKIPTAAVAIRAGREETLPQLCAMMDNLNFVFQTIRDISNIRRDLARRNYTYPIIRAMEAAEIDPRQPATPEQIMGALVLTGSIEKIGRECLSRLEASREISKLLNLPTFTAYWVVVEGLVTELMELFSIKVRPKDSPAKQKRQRSFFAPAIDTLPKVIEMAEGYLLADPTFRESWEVQRRGVFGAPEITAKAFPSGLIIEVLCRNGHNMSGPVDMVFETLQATGFRYYDHDHLPPDADDLGLLLRLYPYSAQPEIHRQILQRPLRRLQESIRESGEIPVWLAQNVEGDKADRPLVSLWGKSCATVEANVLLGLIDYDWVEYRALIKKSALNLFERLIAGGLSATLHYVPLYSLWTVFELIAKLSRPISVALQDNLALQDKLNTAAQALAERLAVEAKRPGIITPQDAAFLTLACHSAALPHASKSLFKPDWITLLSKTQRYDGSWAGEPLFGTPTRGEVATWYTSRSVTSAFCYHALKTYSGQLSVVDAQ